jgi:hypothetical protein
VLTNQREHSNEKNKPNNKRATKQTTQAKKTMSTIMKINDCFTRSSWGDVSLLKAIESDFETDASVEEAIHNLKNLVGFLQGYTTVPVTFPRAFSKTYDRSVDAFLVPVKLSPGSSNELVEMQYEGIYHEFVNAFQLGLAGEVVDIKHLRKGLIEYTIRLSNKITDLTIRSVAMVKDGKIVLVERQETHYSDQTLFSQSDTVPSKEAAVDTLVVGEIVAVEGQDASISPSEAIITASVGQDLPHLRGGEW